MAPGHDVEMLVLLNTESLMLLHLRHYYAFPGLYNYLTFGDLQGA